MPIQDFVTSDSDTIPMDLLARQDPVLDKIIFYDDVSLFEDELHDNGESIMNVRIVSDQSLLSTSFDSAVYENAPSL
jgi:hypothetical protein